MNPLTFKLEDELPALAKIEPDLDRMIEALEILRDLKEDMGTEAHPQYWSEAEGGHLFGVVWMSLVCAILDTPEIKKEMLVHEKAKYLNELWEAYQALRYWWEVLGPHAYSNRGPRGDGVIKERTWNKVQVFFRSVEDSMRIRIDVGIQEDGVTFQVHPGSRHQVSKGSPKSVFVGCSPSELEGSDVLMSVARLLIGRQVPPRAYKIVDPGSGDTLLGSG